MGLEALKGIGEKKGMEIPDEDPKLTRERKEKNAKTLNITEARKEVLKLRKDLKTSTEELEKLKKAVGGASPGTVQIPPEMWGAIPAMIYDYLSFRFGPHWKLNEPEIKIYGQAVQAVADKYLPDYAGNHPQLVMLALVSVAITVPRVKTTIQIRMAEKEPVAPKEKEKEKDKKDAKK